MRFLDDGFDSGSELERLLLSVWENKQESGFPNGCCNFHHLQARALLCFTAVAVFARFFFPPRPQTLSPVLCGTTQKAKKEKRGGDKMSATLEGMEEGMGDQ